MSEEAILVGVMDSLEDEALFSLSERESESERERVDWLLLKSEVDMVDRVRTLPAFFKVATSNYPRSYVTYVNYSEIDTQSNRPRIKLRPLRNNVFDHWASFEKSSLVAL